MRIGRTRKNRTKKNRAILATFQFSLLQSLVIRLLCFVMIDCWLMVDIMLQSLVIKLEQYIKYRFRYERLSY